VSMRPSALARFLYTIEIREFYDTSHRRERGEEAGGVRVLSVSTEGEREREREKFH